MKEENNGLIPEYEPPSVEKALKFFESTLPHRIYDHGQVSHDLISWIKFCNRRRLF